MRIAIGSDHAGVPLNETVIAELKRLGHQVVACGTHDASQPDDYPDDAEAVGCAVLDSKPAVLICGNRRIGRGQQASRHSGRTLSRFLFGAPGRRARQHKRDLFGFAGHWAGIGAGPGAHLPWSPFRGKARHYRSAG